MNPEESRYCVRIWGLLSYLSTFLGMKGSWDSRRTHVPKQGVTCSISDSMHLVLSLWIMSGTGE